MFYLILYTGKKRGCGSFLDRLMAKEICIARTAHKSQMCVICCHDIHINPPFLYHIKVFFFPVMTFLI